MIYAIEILNIVIWPLTIIAILVLFKKPILKLLPYLSTLKYKDLELSFSDQLKEVEQDMKSVSGDDQQKVEYHKDALANQPPTAVVIDHWRKIELAAKEKVSELFSGSKELQLALQRPIEYLQQTGTFIPSTIKNLSSLRSLRNQVIHQPEYAITDELAAKYANLALKMISRIDTLSELPRIKLTALTLLILEINQLIDSGKFDNILIDEIYDHIQNKDVIPFLAERTKGHSDFSLFVSDDGPYSKFIKDYHDQLECIYGGYGGSHRRKWGVENKGLCLLLAWTNEIIQSGAGWYPSDWA